MLDDIRLTFEQLALLAGAATVAGGELDPDYLGEFRPASSAQCVAVRCTSPGVLVRFGALVAVALGYPNALLGQLAARVQEDGPLRPGGERVYYWPGVVAGQTTP